MSEQKEKAQPVAYLRARAAIDVDLSFETVKRTDPNAFPVYRRPPVAPMLLAAAGKAVKELRAIASEIADDSLETAANELEAALNVQKQLTNH